MTHFLTTLFPALATYVTLCCLVDTAQHEYKVTKTKFPWMLMGALAYGCAGLWIATTGVAAAQAVILVTAIMMLVTFVVLNKWLMVSFYEIGILECVLFITILAAVSYGSKLFGNWLLVSMISTFN